MSTESIPGVGATFGPYRIDALVGRGGMGVVYRAHDLRLRRDVALKLLSAQLAADDRFRERFLRESRLAAATEHVGIVPVYEAGEVDGLLYIAMRYIESRDLSTILRAEGALEPPRAIAVVGQLADALDAAHARGLIHRDVKPSNALVAEERGGERVYLVDFGITEDATAGDHLTASGQVVGTLDYLAPERIRSDAVDSRADVYSLACVLFECLTGEVPFPRSSEAAAIYAHLEEPPRPPSELRPELPPALDAAVAAGLAKDPEQRWQTCGELTAAARSAVREPASAPARAPARQAFRRWDRRVLAAALAAASALAVGAIALVSGGGGDERPTAPVSGGQAVALGVASGRIERRLAAGRTPAAVALGGGRVWMVDAEARTLVALDPRSERVETTATGATPVDVAAGPSGVWVMNAAPRRGTFTVGPVASEVVRLDPATQQPRATVPLPPGGSDVASIRDNQLSVSSRAVWAVTANGSIARIDPATAAITSAKRQLRTYAVAAGGAGVWVLRDDDSVARLDERTARVVRKLRPPGGVDALAVSDTAAWVTSVSAGKLWRIGREPDSILGSVDIGAGATDVVTTRQAVWVANPNAGTVTQVDPAAMRVVRVLELGGAPRSLATDGRTVWVTVTGSGAAAESNVEGVKPVGAANCEPVVAGNGGRADLLVTSDLPLQGDSRLSATQVAQAITFVLRERRFRAGRFRIAYQSCDDALVGTGMYDEARCAANGRAFAKDPDVVAVIGSFNSGCTYEVLPWLNRAAGGPVPMISPVNSYVGLTRESPLFEDPASLGKLYPTGQRNFVRVYPADDLAGAALARFASERGRRRAFVLDDGIPDYSGVIARAFVATAKRVGLEVVGRARWKTTRRSYAPLVRRIRSRRADAVLVSGVLNNNGARLIRDLRAGLGSQVDLMGPDGMAPVSSLLAATGRAGRGFFVTPGGLSLAHLPPAGARFVQRFARTQPGIEVQSLSVYAAQATETLLDAIARSNGTRASVLEQLFRTRSTGGLIGEISFDRRGDIRRAGVTILRAVRDAPSTSIASSAGGVPVSAIPVSPEDAEAR